MVFCPFWNRSSAQCRTPIPEGVITLTPPLTSEPRSLSPAPSRPTLSSACEFEFSTSQAGSAQAQAERPLQRRRLEQPSAQLLRSVSASAHRRLWESAHSRPTDYGLHGSPGAQ